MNNTIRNFINRNPATIVSWLLVVNFLVRIIIFYQTKLFFFSDYSSYMQGIENIARGDKQYLLSGNFLYAISYIGFFAKYVLGNINLFFILNCFLGTLSSYILYYLVVRVSGNPMAGIITIIIHTFYTEFIVFSSVFYTPVLMIFLLSLFLLLVYFYLDSKSKCGRNIYLSILVLIFLLTFFFKPELKYFPWFLLLAGVYFFRRNRFLSKKVFTLAFLLLAAYFLLDFSGLISKTKDNIVSNSFIFFGHSDYGGDGGEGSFVYKENETRYDLALKDYCMANNILKPTAKDYNDFQLREMGKFITQHPGKWIGLQFTKFFRTFGVIPESSSFKVLYTGLLNGKLWFTTILVVVPVALIILSFILFFNLSAIKLCKSNSYTTPGSGGYEYSREGFMFIFLLLFVYYIVATVFYGQYQERYRMPVLVVFIIPAVGYFIATFTIKQFKNFKTLIFKGIFIIIFLATWVFQVNNAIAKRDRYEKEIIKLKEVTTTKGN